MPTLIERIKNDPRVSSVWDEGEDGWWCHLKTNWISDDTECGSLHEETLESLYSSLIHGAVRLRHYESPDRYSTDGGWFDPKCVPFVRSEKRLLKLSPFQTFVLADRPEECLEENLREQVKDGYLPHLTEKQISSEVNALKGLFRYSSGKGYEGYLASTIDTYTLTVHQRAVLEDCFSGSTICGRVSHLWDSPDAKERALYYSSNRSIHIIARKFDEVGLESTFIPDA